MVKNQQERKHRLGVLKMTTLELPLGTSDIATNYLNVMTKDLSLTLWDESSVF